MKACLNNNEKIIKIFGHKTPDTDSTCSAIAYANLKNKLGIKSQAYVLGNISKETEFVLNYFKMKKPEILNSIKKGDTMILVDHNEKKQSVDNRDDGEILEVIDHHRVSDFHTNQPLYFRSEPIGCTCTIISKMYMEKNIEIEKNIAGILLSAILSDTLLYTSPTCTDEDKKIGDMLEKIAQVSYKEYGKEMFKEGSDISNMTVKEILEIDAKPFEIGNKKIKIAQVTVLETKEIFEKETNILKEMEKISMKENYKLFILVVTDLMKNGSYILIKGEDREIGCKIFKMETKATNKFLDGVVSRKKQVVPLLYDGYK